MNTFLPLWGCKVADATHGNLVCNCYAPLFEVYGQCNSNYRQEFVTLGIFCGYSTTLSICNVS